MTLQNSVRTHALWKDYKFVLKISKTSGKSSAMIKIPRKTEDPRRISQNKNSLLRSLFAVYFADFIRINGRVSRVNPATGSLKGSRIGDNAGEPERSKENF